MKIDKFAKAIVGGLIAALSTLAGMLVGGGGSGTALTFADITAGGWVAVALGFITTFAGVYFIPNSPEVVEPPVDVTPMYVSPVLEESEESDDLPEEPPSEQLEMELNK